MFGKSIHTSINLDKCKIEQSFNIVIFVIFNYNIMHYHTSNHDFVDYIHLSYSTKVLNDGKSRL
jgi:hypothetical protein